MTDASLIAPAELEAPSTPVVVAKHRRLTHSGVTISRYAAMHVGGAAFPLLAGLACFGWRAAGCVGTVVLTYAIAALLISRTRWRLPPMPIAMGLWHALLLGLILPAHLYGGRANVPGVGDVALWPLLPAAAILLAALDRLLAGPGAGRVHAVVVTYLILTVLFYDALVPHYVLNRNHAFRGDLLKAQSSRATESWVNLPPAARSARRLEPASQRLIFYTSGQDRPDRKFISLETLMRDRLPPLDDLVLFGHAGPIGTAGGIAVIMGGLFLLYRGLIDVRIPIVILLVAMLTLLVLPIPAVITERTVTWRWLPIFDAGIGWMRATTFACYELFAGPLVFVAFFLATSPAVRPLNRRARTIYAALIGFFAAVFQLYASVAIGAYLALLLAGLFAPIIDARFRAKPIV